ncbi:MAG: hypothetical protein JWN15_2823 [Firmicutes bacterium]|nr:hypothetical protein [Bacillota bacterium]
MLGTLVACSPGPEGKGTPALPVNPTPTKPGEVVVLAGDGQESNQPEDGAYAVRTSITPVGGIAAGHDGSVYFGVKYGDSARVARVAPDGRLHLLDPHLKVHDDSSFRMYSTKMVVSKTDLWLFSSDNKGSLQKIPLHQSAAPRYMFGSTTDSHVVFINDKGHEFPANRQRELNKSWRASTFGLGPNNQPIVATESGDLYELIGENKLRPWNPVGYQAVLGRVRQRGGELTPLYPGAVISDETENVYIVGNSTILIPRNGPATSIGKGFPGADPSWSGGVALAKERLLLTRSVNYDGILLVLNGDDSERQISLGSGKECIEGGDRTSLNNGGLYGLTRRPDGTLITTACNHVFGFRPME